MSDQNAQFAGSIPAIYDRYLGPILFQPYAEDLAARLDVTANGSVLELACGTGILTRILRNRLPAPTRLVATDLNEAMMQRAAIKFAKEEAVEWRQADACSLPFDDHSFEAVICQFGIMFFPDKIETAREARRLLKSGGIFLFNVWDALEHNALGRIAHETIGQFFEKDPPMFYQVPFGYHDQDAIRRVLEEAGFRDITFDVVPKIGIASRAEDVSIGLVQGNPVAAAIADRDPSLLAVITKAVADALKKHFGETVSAPMRAVVIKANA